MYVEVMVPTKCMLLQLMAVHAQGKDEQKQTRWGGTSRPRT
jgi:hypothetical protein